MTNGLPLGGAGLGRTFFAGKFVPPTPMHVPCLLQDETKPFKLEYMSAPEARCFTSVNPLIFFHFAHYFLYEIER